MKPTYYKALWHNCNMCKIHYMSESPHIRAYLCDECWNSIPHFKVGKMKPLKVRKGPTHPIFEELGSLEYILAYILGCSMCLFVIAYYLWFK